MEESIAYFGPIVFSDDGTLLAAAANARDDSMPYSVNNDVTVFDVNTGRALATWKDVAGELTLGALAFSPDGKFVAAASFEASVFSLEDPHAPPLELTMKEVDSGGEIEDLVFSPDGHHLVATTQTGTNTEPVIHDWTIPGTPASSVVECNCAANVATVSREAQTVAFGTIGGDIALWDLAERRQIRMLHEGKGPITHIALADSSHRLVTKSDLSGVVVWTLGNDRRTREIVTNNAWGGIHASTDGRTLLTPFERDHQLGRAVWRIP